MSQFLKRRFNQVLSGSECVLAANVFDPLSARIASLLDYEVCFLSGSVGKTASLGVPDLVMTNILWTSVWNRPKAPSRTIRGGIEW